jgi:hypothetical protein
MLFDSPRSAWTNTPTGSVANGESAFFTGLAKTEPYPGAFTRDVGPKSKLGSLLKWVFVFGCLAMGAAVAFLTHSNQIWLWDSVPKPADYASHADSSVPHRSRVGTTVGEGFDQVEAPPPDRFARSSALDEATDSPGLDFSFIGSDEVTDGSSGEEEQFLKPIFNAQKELRKAGLRDTKGELKYLLNAIQAVESLHPNIPKALRLGGEDGASDWEVYTDAVLTNFLLTDPARIDPKSLPTQVIDQETGLVQKKSALPPPFDINQVTGLVQGRSFVTPAGDNWEWIRGRPGAFPATMELNRKPLNRKALEQVRRIYRTLRFSGLVENSDRLSDLDRLQFDGVTVSLQTTVDPRSLEEVVVARWIATMPMKRLHEATQESASSWNTVLPGFGAESSNFEKRIVKIDAVVQFYLNADGHIYRQFFSEIDLLIDNKLLDSKKLAKFLDIVAKVPVPSAPRLPFW